MFKKIGLFFITIASMFALVSGCTNVDVEDLSKMEFINFPQSTYMMIESSDIARLTEAYNTLLGEITIKITNKDGNSTSKSLLTAISEDLVSIKANDEIFDANVLTTEGTKTMVITLGSNKKVKLTYVFSVVKNEQTLFAGGKGTEIDPYQIATPQQFMNLFARYFGVPVPSSDNELAWMYYYQFSFPYFASGKYYKITNDLDFTGITFRPLGALGGINYIPFTGVLDGNNKSIKNLTINFVGDYCAIFAGIANAEIKDLVLDNINTGVSSAKYTAALASYAIPASESLIDGNDQTSVYTNKINKIDNVDVKNSLIAGAYRAGAITVKMVATQISNCDVDANTKVIGFGTIGGIAGQPHSQYVYKYSDRTSDSFNEFFKRSAFINLNDIKDCTFLGTVVADPAGLQTGAIFGYGWGNNQPSGFIQSEGVNKLEAEERATIQLQNTYSANSVKKYEPTGSEVVKYAVATEGDQSNRVFELPNDLSSIQSTNKNTYVQFFDANGNLNSALTEVNVDTTDSIIIGEKLYVNNRIDLVNIDGENVGYLYYPIKSFDSLVTIYVVNGKIVGVLTTTLS